jgi:homocysteine S-methyltransferase
MTFQERRHVTDGGLETDLIFHHGWDLPEFAAFPLLDSDEGRAALADYYRGYVDVAIRAGAPVLLEPPTWRANPDHAERLGYGPPDLDRIDRESVQFLHDLVRVHERELVGWSIGGMIGPRGDGYRTDGPVSREEAADYHRPQVASFRAAGADRVTALTLTDVGEAVGVAWAAADVGLPAAIGFTVETDGRLPDGTTLAAAVGAVDAVAHPAYFVVNCAHPSHVLAGMEDGPWRGRVGGLRVNASTLSHAELDEAIELDEGDPTALAAAQLPLLDAFDRLEALGGCCGTDVRHVAAMWGLS